MKCLYDAPPALKKFLTARESGNASKELLIELNRAALAELHEGKPKAPVIDFETARLKREQPK